MDLEKIITQYVYIILIVFYLTNKIILENIKYHNQEQIPLINHQNPKHKYKIILKQFHIIFRAMSEYIKEKMIEGKVFKIIYQGVNIKNFGAFTFEVISDLVKPI